MDLPEDQSFVDTLILEGALVISGVNDEGEIVYNVTDRLKELAPDLYHEFLKILKDSVMGLWEKGFIDMDVTKENPLIAPTDKALDLVQWKHLSKEEEQTLAALLKAFGEGK